MIYAVFDPVKRNITFANAGHLPPLFTDSSGSRFLEIDSGLPLGIQEVIFSEYELEMTEGSRLLLYSDGVSEAMNSSLEEYGTERIQDHMSQPDASVESLFEDVHTFTGDYPATDDKTLVMIRGK
jgi:sigma-B regulation protein RsbU (phosphoserine phosphatase)